jgi:hypothetical protein
VSTDTFLAGMSTSIFPRSAQVSDEKVTGKVFRWFYTQPEREIPTNSDLYHQALSAGTLITRDDDFRD